MSETPEEPHAPPEEELIRNRRENLRQIEESGQDVHPYKYPVSATVSQVVERNRERSAEELQSAIEEAQRNGTQARMRLPFEATLDRREPKFYAPPQPALPPKDLAQPPAQVYQQPGQNA